MDTFALFDDGSTARILIGFLEPDDVHIPLEPVPINIPDREIKHSAQNGFYSALQVLKGIGYIKEKYCFSYQFKEKGKSSYALGKSAGLGFCLKFAQEVCFRESGRKLDFALAATGAITDGTKTAEVGRVGGIRLKLQGAMDCLDRGDKIFYPSENDEEIGLEIKKDASRRGIDLISVSTVEQAITKLLEKFPLEEYPIEIMGLGEPVSGLGSYCLGRYVFGWRINAPIKLINKGNLDVEVKGSDSDEEFATDWLHLSLPHKSLPAHDVIDAGIDILPQKRLLFYLRNFYKFFFKKEGRLSLFSYSGKRAL